LLSSSAFYLFVYFIKLQLKTVDKKLKFKNKIQKDNFDEQLI